MALRSAGDFRRPLRSLTGKNRMRVKKRTERSMILGANSRLADAKSSMLQLPGRGMHVRSIRMKKGRRERAVLYLIEIETKKGQSFAFAG